MEKNNIGIKKFRLNIIDILIILVAALSIAVLVYVFSGSKINFLSNNKSVMVTYEIEVEQLRDEWQGLVQIGDKVFDVTSVAEIGEVVNVSYSPAQFIGYDDELGKMVYSDYPDYVKMTITVMAKCQPDEGGYSVNNYLLKVGNPVQFRTPKLTREGTVKSIELSDTLSGGQTNE